MNELPEGLGRFAAGELTFEVDDGYSLVQLSDGRELDEQSLDRRLLESGRVPASAPLASWILARLHRISGGSLALEDETIEICEGALYVIDFVLRREGTALGKVQLQAGSTGAALLGVVSKELDPAQAVDLFVEAILAAPDEVASCRARVRDPEWPEDRITEYGYDGSTYL